MWCHTATVANSWIPDGIEAAQRAVGLSSPAELNIELVIACPNGQGIG